MLIVTGQFDEQQTLAAIAESFGRHGAAVRMPIPEPYTLDRAQQGEREVKLRRSGGIPLLYGRISHDAGRGPRGGGDCPA